MIFLVVMIILIIAFQKKISILLISVAGGIFHNLGQVVGAYVILRLDALFSYIPLLIIFGIIAGMLTAVLLKVMLPYLNNINKRVMKMDK